MARRDALRGLVVGAAAVTAGSAFLTVDEPAAGKSKRRKSKNKKKPQTAQPNSEGSVAAWVPVVMRCFVLVPLYPCRTPLGTPQTGG